MLKNHDYMLNINSNLAKNTVLFYIMLFSVVFISSCGDDDDPEDVDSLVDVYVLSSATATGDVTYMGQTIITDGQDILVQVSGALLRASPCDQTDITLIEIEADGTFDLICQSDNNLSADGGGWGVSENRTSLTLSLLQEVGGSTVSVPIRLDNLEETSTNVSGAISDLSLPAFFFDPEEEDQTVTVNVDLILMFTRA
ncbi:MAG: hypothetical protein AAGC64_05255 [Bacteroidota bacterium]